MSKDEKPNDIIDLVNIATRWKMLSPYVHMTAENGSASVDAINLFRSMLDKVAEKLSECPIVIEKDESDETVWAMLRYGGYFVKALAWTIHTADNGNKLKIKQVFGDYWLEYYKLGKEKHELYRTHAGEHHCLDCGAFFPIIAGEPDCPECGSRDWQDVDGSLPKNDD